MATAAAKLPGKSMSILPTVKTRQFVDVGGAPSEDATPDIKKEGEKGGEERVRGRKKSSIKRGTKPHMELVGSTDRVPFDCPPSREGDGRLPIAYNASPCTSYFNVSCMQRL